MKVTSIIAAVMGAIIRVVMAVAVVYVIYRGAGICYEYGYRIFTEPAVEKAPGRDVSVRIYDKMSEIELGSLLEEKGLVENGLLFAIQFRLSSYDNKVKSGKYTLNTSQTSEEIIQFLAGEEVEE